MIRNIPNLISLLRLAAVPVVVWLILSDRIFEAFIVFLIAGISDGLDGFLARAFKAKTKLGGYLDPIADKALLVAVYVSLAVVQMIPLWLVLVVVFRDLVIIGGILLSFILRIHLEMSPLWISKVNTVLQIAFAAFVLSGLNESPSLGYLAVIFPYLVGTTTVLSGVQYVTMGLKRLDKEDSA